MKSSHLLALIVILVALSILVVKAEAKEAKPTTASNTQGVTSSKFLSNSATNPIVDSIASVALTPFREDTLANMMVNASGASVLDASNSGNADGKATEHQYSTNDAGGGIQVSSAPSPTAGAPVGDLTSLFADIGLSVINTMQPTVAQSPNVAMTTPGSNASQGVAPLPTAGPNASSVTPVATTPPATSTQPPAPAPAPAPVVAPAPTPAPAPAPAPVVFTVPESVINAIKVPPVSTRIQISGGSGAQLVTEVYDRNSGTKFLNDSEKANVRDTLLAKGYKFPVYPISYGDKWDGWLTPYDLSYGPFASSKDANYLSGATYSDLDPVRVAGSTQASTASQLPFVDGKGNVIVKSTRSSDGRGVYVVIPIAAA